MSTTTPEATQAGITPFEQLMYKKWMAGKRLCLGLDPDYDKLPKKFKEMFENINQNILDPILSKTQAIRVFLKRTIAATHTKVLCYKPNIAFYYKLGLANGAVLFEEIIAYIKELDPEMPIIMDWKIGDIGNTNIGYLEAIKLLGVHAFTASPYLGMEDGIDVLFSDPTKYVFVLCLTSNKGSKDIQEKLIDSINPVYMEVANLFSGSTKRNIGLVTGATKSEKLGDIRQETGDDQLFLLPGIGTQQGDVDEAVYQVKNEEQSGFVPNVSRAVLYCTDEADFEPHVVNAIDKYTDQINQAMSFANED